jgi:hypothetical protein
MVGISATSLLVQFQEPEGRVVTTDKMKTLEMGACRFSMRSAEVRADSQNAAHRKNVHGGLDARKQPRRPVEGEEFFLTSPLQKLFQA